MVLRLDHSAPDFANRFAAFLTTKREVSADVEADVRAIVDARLYGAHRLPFGPMRRLAHSIGCEALRATLEASTRYEITLRRPSLQTVRRRAAAVELMLAERFVALVFDLDQRLGSRAEALAAAQQDMQTHVQAFSGMPGVNLRKWAPVELRGLQRRFAAMVRLVDEKHGRLPNRPLATLQEQPPIHSIKRSAAKPGRKRRQ